MTNNGDDCGTMKVCPKHSGIEAAINYLKWFLGISIVVLLGVGGFQFTMLSQIGTMKSDLQQSLGDVKRDIADIKARVEERK